MDTLSTKVYTNAKDTLTTNREMTLSQLKEIVGPDSRSTYSLKVQARKQFRGMGYRNWLQMAEVFMEIYIASFRTRDPDGWFFKDYKWWENHHGLTETVVRTAVDNLIDLGLIEKKHGQGNKMYFRLFPAVVVEVLYPLSFWESDK